MPTEPVPDYMIHSIEIGADQVFVSFTEPNNVTPRATIRSQIEIPFESDEVRRVVDELLDTVTELVNLGFVLQRNPPDRLR